MDYSNGFAVDYTASLGVLDYGTKYYWRVDGYGGDDEYTGFVWSFTIGGRAIDPIVADSGQVNRLVGQLSSSRDGLISSCDVYFGYPDDLTNCNITIILLLMKECKL